MTYTWQDLTPETVVNLFLYGEPTKPANLDDDALIRSISEERRLPGALFVFSCGEQHEEQIEKANATLPTPRSACSKRGASVHSSRSMWTRFGCSGAVIVTICKRALAGKSPMTTRELAVYVIREKGLDEADAVLRTSIAYRIVQAMRLQWKRGKVDSPEKQGNVRVWQL